MPLCAGLAERERQGESTDRPVWHVLVGDVPLRVFVSQGKEAMGVLKATWGVLKPLLDAGTRPTQAQQEARKPCFIAATGLHGLGHA